jgi:hypothetical protein
MKNASHLAPGHDPALAAQIAKTWPGQAHWAGSGPPGLVCGQCGHLGYQAASSRRENKNASLWWLRKISRTHRQAHGPVVPASCEACRHFTPRNDNALGE